MKKLLLILLPLIILAAAGYSALWFTQAKVAQDQVTNILEQANQHHPFITYESVTTTGFPNAVGVSINKPTLDVPAGQLLKALGENMPVAPDGSDIANMRKALLALPHWEEKLTLDGRIVITVDTLSNTYNIKPEGSYSGTTNLNNESWVYNGNAGSDRRECNIAFHDAIASESFLNLWNWELLSEDPKQLLQHLKQVDCYIPNYEWNVGASNQPLYTTKPMHIYFANASDGPNINVEFDIDIPGLLTTQVYDEFAKKYWQVLYDYPMPEYHHFSLYGEQSFRVKGKVKLNEDEPHLHPMHIAIDEFSFNSDVSNTNYTARFITNPTGEMSGNGELYTKMTASSNEQGYKLYLSQAEKTANNLYAQMQYAGGLNFGKEELIEAFKQLVPKTHELGEMVFEIDAKGQAAEDGKVTVDLNKIEMGATPYGLNATGSLSMASILIPIPTGEINMTCRSCTPFITDLVNWLGRLKPLAQMAEDTEEYQDLVQLDEQEVSNRVIAFLKQIDPKGTEDLNFAIKLASDGALTINQMDTAVLMQLFNQELAPLLEPQPEPELTEGELSEVPPSAAAPTPAYQQSPISDTMQQ